MLGVHPLGADLFIEHADPALQVPGVHPCLISQGLFFGDDLVQGRNAFSDPVILFL